jgi:hypothetical protein
MKPHIKRARSFNGWVCVSRGDFATFAMGATIREAYATWRQAKTRKVRAATRKALDRRD